MTEKDVAPMERRQYKLKRYIIEVMYIEKYAKLGVFLVFLPTKPESMNRKKRTTCICRYISHNKEDPFGQVKRAFDTTVR